MMPDFVNCEGIPVFHLLQQAQGVVIAGDPGRMERYSRGTVSRLWLKTSGLASMTRFSAAPSLRRKSGVRISMVVPRTIAARIWLESYFGEVHQLRHQIRSSRSTEVMTTCFSPMVGNVASATRRGSSASSALQASLPVFTLQKLQALRAGVAHES
jgi:hypothetical protein